MLIEARKDSCLLSFLVPLSYDPAIGGEPTLVSGALGTVFCLTDSEAVAASLPFFVFTVPFFRGADFFAAFAAALS
jgi:hypothetical protein